MSATLRAALCTAAIACLPVGCSRGPELSAVEGRVLYNGRPLEFGTVMFQPPEGQPSQARIRPDGSFSMETFGHGRGAVVGVCRVRVTCFESERPGAEGGFSDEPAMGRMLIPERYAHYATSGLTVEILRGNNEPLRFELHD